MKKRTTILMLICMISLSCDGDLIHDAYEAMKNVVTGPGDTTPPTVIEVSPLSDAVNVPVTSVVTAKFSEDMDETTVNGTTFILTPAGGTAIASTVSYTAATKTALILPDASLNYGITYTATVTNGVKDKAGNALPEEYSWSFNTVMAVPRDGLVGEWLFSGNANDTSGKGNNGTLNGPGGTNNLPQSTADRFGNSGSAYNFDGTDDCISIPYSESFNFSSDDQIAISLWVKQDYIFNDSGEHVQMLITKYTHDTGTYAWHVSIHEKSFGGLNEYNVNNGLFWGREKQGDSWTYSTSQSEIQLNTYYHVVALYNGTSMKIFINGFPEDESNNAVNVSAGETDIGIMIGQCLLSQPYWFHGTIDDVRIYNRALTEDEIAALYYEVAKGAYPTPPDGLIAQTIQSDEIFISPAIVIDSTNKFNIVYCIQKGNNPYTYSIIHTLYDGSTWENMIITSNGGLGYERGFCKSKNNDDLYVGYYDPTNWDVRYAHFTANKWNTYPVSSGYSNFEVITLKTDTNDKLHITNRDGYTTLYYSTNKSGSFVRTSLDNPVTGSHDILFDSLNGVHVLYAERGGAVRYTNDSNWASNVAISGNAPVDCGRSPEGAMYNDKIYAVYEWVTDGSYNYSNIYHVNNSSGSWQTETIASNVSRLAGRKFLFDDPSNMYVVCANKSNQLVLFTNRSGLWEAHTILSADVGQYINACKMNNNIYIIYTSVDDKSIYLKTINVTDYN